MSRQASSRKAATGRNLPYPFIVMVTDRGFYGSAASREGARLASLIAAAEACARAGIDAVQIRERGLEDAQLLTLVADITGRIAGTTARVLVNDRLDIAMMAGASGVHLPANALPCARARTIVPDSFVIGRSVHSIEEAMAEAAAGGCDYLLFGTVFASQSKPAGHPVAGIDALERICAAVTIPVVAIGGMTADRARAGAGAGAAGLAGIGLFASGTEQALADTVGSIRDAFIGGQ
jgi:thiamine-phosphate diphosphorylase